MSRLSPVVFAALKHVRLVALQVLSDRGMARPIRGPLAVSNRGLARRFELMSDAALVEHIRRSESDVAYLIFQGLHDVLYGGDASLCELAGQLSGEFATAAAATSAALLAVDHFSPRIVPSVRPLKQDNRPSEYFDAAENPS